MAFNGPFAILGFFLGYISGPILAERTEEREERMKHVGDLTGTGKCNRNSFVSL
jgi:hypothetical protein